jgi:ketosteroid isomerase-like protein
MSQENVDIVRQCYLAFNDRRTDAVTDLIDPQFRWEPGPDDPEREPRVGHEDTLSFLDAQWKALPGLTTEIEDVIDGEADVVVVVRHAAVVPGSDAKIERREAHLWTLRNGRISSLREFATREQALEAAGLSE